MRVIALQAAEKPSYQFVLTQPEPDLFVLPAIKCSVVFGRRPLDGPFAMQDNTHKYWGLATDQTKDLLASIAEQIGPRPKFERFSELVLSLLDDIAGFETASVARRSTIVKQLWRTAMGNSENTAEATAKGPANKALYAKAVTQGKQLITEGKTKAEVATVIFGLLKAESKEVVIAAFVEGATLTEKGAVTYWYNCRRKVKKA